MTREEAIKLIEHVSIVFMPTDQYGDYDDPQPYEEAFDMAIEALQREEAEEKGYCHRIRPKEERKEPKSFIADEWYREEFRGEI